MRITLEDVAKAAGVSVVTVSRVLNGKYLEKVGPKTRKRVLETAKRLNYKPNIMARGLQKGRTHLVGVVLDRIVDSFFGDILQGIQDAAMEADLAVIVYTRPTHLADDKFALDDLCSRRVDGILYFPNRSPANIREVVERGIPVVQLCNSHNQVRAPYVKVDHRRGAYMATEHLIRLGHRRIAHLGAHGNGDVQGLDRLIGYRMALSDHELPYDESIVIESDYTRTDGYRSVKELLERTRDVTAIFACSDFTAVGAMRALEEEGLRVPDDIAVVGFDDLHFSAWLSVPLTTVAQPKEEIGQTAIKTLLALIEGESVPNTTFDPELIVRKSCGACKLHEENIC